MHCLVPGLDARIPVTDDKKLREMVVAIGVPDSKVVVLKVAPGGFLDNSKSGFFLARGRIRIREEDGAYFQGAVDLILHDVVLGPILGRAIMTFACPFKGLDNNMVSLIKVAR